MRLINVHDLTLKEFTATTPEYVVLSHCWTDDELSFKDLSKPRNLQSLGFEKIKNFCEYVKKGGPDRSNISRNKAVNWVWVVSIDEYNLYCETQADLYSSLDQDTCCIDKRSSAELSEAINSMWKIYGKSLSCVVHLADVPSLDTGREHILSKLTESRWFTRGWTLQELLAPFEVIFCNSNWETIGMLHRDLKLQDAVAEATRIEKVYLVNYIDKGGTLNRACVAKKLSWASTRQTTRPEDMAYCLLGLLDVNMPLLYGEGAKKAFLRLQHEFLKQSDDESIFAWTRSSNVRLKFGLLAPEIGLFHHAGDIEPIPSFDSEYTNRPPYTITNKGLQFRIERRGCHAYNE